jgi:hypothetical protein
MKKKAVALDIDFIGSQDELTKEEELSIRNYFAKRRAERSKLIKNRMFSFI